MRNRPECSFLKMRPVGLLVCFSLMLCGTWGCASGSEELRDQALDGDIEHESDRVDSTESDSPESEAEEEADSPQKVGDFLPIPAVTSCTPKADACAVATVVNATHATYRKDNFYPTDVYPEPTEEPLDGGRFHIVTTAQASGTITSISINGTNVEDLLTQKKIEWYHYWPQSVTAGRPVWVAFHSRNAEWDQASSGQLSIRTETEETVNTEFAVAANPVPITYVTTDETRTVRLIHLQNADSKPHTVTRLIVDGVDVLEAGIACLPSGTIAPGEAVMWTVPQCQPLKLGAPWSVVVEFSDLTPSVGVGRVIRPFFPIEAWPNSSECPLPGVNDATHRLATQGGLDTLYIYWNGYQECGYDRDMMFNETLPARADTFLLLGDDFPFENPPENALPNREAILGFLTGDESDWNIYDENGYPNAAKKAAKTRAVWSHFPDLFTYNGAMTNKRIGTFAGMADVQGIDLYTGACPPHIFDFGFFPPLRAPYDYLRNARNNHMPLPTWLYSQGIHGGWPTQPTPQEILVQALSVVAAGGKGLMWFQYVAELAKTFPETWAAMVKANWIIRGVRKYLREGDITGMARSDNETLVELIRSREVIVVPMITLAADEGPTDEQCLRFQLGIEPEPPRWILTEREVSLTVTLPDDFSIEDAFEITDGHVADLAYPASLSGRELTLEGIPFNNDRPVRVLVFAANLLVRENVAAAMTPPQERP